VRPYGWPTALGVARGLVFMAVATVSGIQGCSPDFGRSEGAGQRFDKAGVSAPLPPWLLAAIPKGQREHPEQATKIQIGSHAVEDKDLSCLKQFPKMETVILTGQKLTEGSLPYLCQVARLKRLRITFPLTRKGWGDLKAMRSLEDLDITGVKLGTEDIDALTQLRDLRCLSLSADLAPDGTIGRLSVMSSLRELTLVHASSSDNGLQELRKLARLDALHLHFLHDTGDPLLAQLEGLRNLVTVGLADTKVTDDGIAYLASLPNLAVVDLRNTAVTDAALQHLASCPRIQVLHLENTKITGAGIRYLANMQELEMLYLDRTGVNNEGLRYLPGLKRLRTLSIRRCLGINETGLQWLKGMESLEYLGITSRIHAGAAPDGGPRFVQLMDPVRVKDVLSGLKNLHIADLDEQGLFDLMP